MLIICVIIEFGNVCRHLGSEKLGIVGYGVRSEWLYTGLSE